MTGQPTTAALELRIRRLLEWSGVEVGDILHEPVVTSPTEPLQDVAAGRWIYAAALHLTDILRSARTVCKMVDRLDGGDTSVLGEDGADLYFTIFPELEFHAFYFPLYAQMVREALLRPELAEFAVLRPRMEHLPGAPQPLSSTATERLMRQTCMTREQVLLARNDLARLRAACSLVSRAVERFAVADSLCMPTLAQEFVNVQSAVLMLASAILDADVTARDIMAHWR